MSISNSPCAILSTTNTKCQRTVTLAAQQSSRDRQVLQGCICSPSSSEEYGDTIISQEYRCGKEMAVARVASENGN
jgi:hypothetical protein